MIEAKKAWGRIKSFLADLCFPQFCFGCRKEGSYLCPDCLAVIDVLSSFFCLCPEPRRLERPGKCSACQKSSLDGLYFAAAFRQPLVKRLIRQYQSPPYVKELGKNLADLIISHFALAEKQKELGGSLLVPVPIDRAAWRTHGFNPAQEIAQNLARAWRLPCLIDALMLNEDGSNGFTSQKQSLVDRKKIFLVDGLYVTGQIMEKGARALKEAGAKEVWGIAVARGQVIQRIDSFSNE
ncbi:MAG: ComF family protein [Candidatus Nealsonbacteria bacterium]|nr:ComF family protein [Candidatus Nealsonbacteria bacterium]